MTGENKSLQDKMVILANPLLLIFAAIYFVIVVGYYQTGAGGPTLLAVSLLPVAYILATLDSIRKKSSIPAYQTKHN
ncbi:hypothetical protein [Natranaerofaba carboxydovora]|uniref:hypothetical protein n=1 Tax=Natranaerofaba carboxydovora TaxID=2742683 RepID=UPI001F13A1B3|nr:hypothetical protein [Natranaerofaba carboxydovora]UMZ73702.1 hypothetical protein ACONDI_01267 [Natranaerofaba carboxydovora]